MEAVHGLLPYWLSPSYGKHRNKTSLTIAGMDGLNSQSRNELPGSMVLDTYVHALGWDAIIEKLIEWVVNRESRYVCLCNVHSTVTAQSDPLLALALSQSDMVLPDGMPIAWMLRKNGFKKQPRIGGPDLMWKCTERFQQLGQSIFLYGSTIKTLEKLERAMYEKYPNLKIAGMVSPPFRDLSAEEEAAIADQINNSGAHALFVALGCPKQEVWMQRQRGKIMAVMFGFGAAFDFHAGNLRRAPYWMQRAGLEWLYRLAKEPSRLWRRYLVTNSKFLLSVLLSSKTR